MSIFWAHVKTGFLECGECSRLQNRETHQPPRKVWSLFVKTFQEYYNKNLFQAMPLPTQCDHLFFQKYYNFLHMLFWKYEGGSILDFSIASNFYWILLFSNLLVYGLYNKSLGRPYLPLLQNQIAISCFKKILFSISFHTNSVF